MILHVVLHDEKFKLIKYQNFDQTACRIEKYVDQIICKKYRTYITIILHCSLHPGDRKHLILKLFSHVSYGYIQACWYMIIYVTHI